MIDIKALNLRTVSRLFTALIVISAMAAYNLFGVPLQWIGQLGILALAFLLLAKAKPHAFPGLPLIFSYLLWALVVTTLRAFTEDLSTMLPEKATTGYWVYILLRFVSILNFIAAAYIANWLAETEGVKPLLNRMAWIGFAGACYGIYIYIAQVYGLPEPPRTRLGTGGAEQSVVFSYAFHRAMGSFREPSHLAEWLIFPIYATMIGRRFSSLRVTVNSICLLLTGSLTGIIGFFSGLILASFFLMRHALSQLKVLMKPALPIILALAISSGMVVANNLGSSSIVDTLWKRIEPVFSDRGLSATNRDYVFQYYDRYPLPVLGQGLGNANIRFSRAYHLEAVGSFLNLYIANLYAVGVIGFCILLMVLLYPLLRVRKFIGGKPNLEAFVLVSAYIGWLFIYFVHSEELSIHFGILFGLLVSIGREPQSQPRQTASGSHG